MTMIWKFAKNKLVLIPEDLDYAHHCWGTIYPVMLPDSSLLYEAWVEYGYAVQRPKFIGITSDLQEAKSMVENNLEPLPEGRD